MLKIGKNTNLTHRYTINNKMVNTLWRNNDYLIDGVFEYYITSLNLDGKVAVLGLIRFKFDGLIVINIYLNDLILAT